MTSNSLIITTSSLSPIYIPNELTNPASSSIVNTPLVSNFLKIFLKKYSSWLKFAFEINLYLIKFNWCKALFFPNVISFSSFTFSNSFSIYYMKYSSSGIIVAISLIYFVKVSFDFKTSGSEDEEVFPSWTASHTF